MVRKVILATLVIAMCFTLGTIGKAVQVGSYDVDVYVDMTPVDFVDQEPYIDINNRTMVPVRFVSEALGANVEWDGDAQVVDIDLPATNRVINMTIGEKGYAVNDRGMEMDTEPAIKNSRTVVPLRFVSEGLGAEVEWDGENRIVSVSLPQEPVMGEGKEYPITEFEGGVLVDIHHTEDRVVIDHRGHDFEKAPLVTDRGYKIHDYYFKDYDCQFFRGDYEVYVQGEEGQAGYRSYVFFEEGEIDWVSSTAGGATGEMQERGSPVNEWDEFQPEDVKFMVFIEPAGNRLYVVDKPRIIGGE